MAESSTIVVPESGTSNSMLPYAMMANGGMNNWMNNPFAYLMFLPFMYGMAGNGWGNNGVNNGAAGAALADAVSTQNQIQNLSNQITDNQNSNLTMGAINNVASAVRDNGVALNAGIDTVNSGICGLNQAVNAQGYQNQLANCQQTNTILQQSQALTNTVQNGFTNLGYQLQSGLCDAKQNSTNNTQRIIDTLNNKWSTDAAATITQLRDELATVNQTNALIAALKTTTTTTT